MLRKQGDSGPGGKVLDRNPQGAGAGNLEVPCP